ncbi:MAG TPA: ABC transporter ATP-binding protein, partial [Geobacteraceae bacterium]
LNPGSVKGLFQVDLPRPRIRQELYLKEPFLVLRDRLVTVLHENILSELDDGQTVRSVGEGI